MHADEIETDAGLVRRLLTEQFRRWADLPIRRVASAGTDNALYRLGEDLVADSQLAVLPGTSHFIRPGSGLLDRSDWLLAMIPPFLDAPMPAAD